MKWILKSKWMIIVVWILTAVGLFLSAPNMQNLVRDKGQIKVPEGYSSNQASKLMEEFHGQKDGSGELQTALAFHDDKGISEADKTDIKQSIDQLKEKQNALGITSITTHFDQPELEKDLVAKDGKTILTAITLKKNGRTAAEMRDALNDTVKNVKVEHYFTGSWLIDEDMIFSSQEGLKKTEYITVIFILLILFFVFRSLIAPFIPLLTVGISYVIAQSVVGFLVDKANFPLSTFTQIFMVAVMFGIGTDYCILLISRFKEELAHGNDVTTSVLITYRTAGKTVFFSGLAVLVGFTSIGLSTFVLYRSAVAVAVGVAVLLLALVTVVPFFMAVLGKRIFWPVTKSLEHKPSRMWGAAGKFALRRPLITLLLILALIGPFLFSYKGQLSFNSLDEIGNAYNSVKGFQVISDSFGPGDSLPTQIVLKHAAPMDRSKDLAVIEKISREIEKVDGVKMVRTVTRPAGEEIKDLQVSNQVGTLDDGLSKGKDGLDQIKLGLADASTGLASNAPKLNEAVQGTNQLVAGTSDLKNGVVQLGAALSQLEQGLKDGSVGAGDLKKGLQQIQASAEQLAASNQQLLTSYQQVGDSITVFSQKYREIENGLNGVTQGISGAQQSLGNLAQKHPELQNDPDFQTAAGTLAQVQTGASQLSAGLKQLNDQFSKVESGIKQANSGFAKTSAGQHALTHGLTSLIDGLSKLQSGIDQTAWGQSQINGKMPSLINGIDQVNYGQKQMQTGFSQLNGQLSQLTNGLNQSVDGLAQVSTGLKSAQGYLEELSSSTEKSMSGWFIPDQALQSADFKKAMDAYMSPDRKMVTFDVVFDKNPYATESLNKIDDIKAAMSRALKGTDLDNSNYAVGGVTSIFSDLNNISSQDYKRTATIMLIGIAVILILLLRSLIMPIYLIASLVLTYYTSMAVAEGIFVKLLGHSGLTWAVPFFAFVMLMALGIDYSIFLMDRFKEYRHLSVEDAILESMRKMGTVIISAVIILGGTFAAMLPSGVLSLLEISTIVLTGLVLYSLVFLPFFIPVMVKTFGSANWWPFRPKPVATDQEEGLSGAYQGL